MIDKNLKLDFVGVATPRGGTTWISKCLSEHPDVCVLGETEPHFFLYDSKYNQGTGWFAKRFKHCSAKEKMKGEWSNLYLYSKKAALRIKKHNPNAKIVMCLRNPAIRAHSQYINRRYNATIMPFYSFKYIINHEDKYHYLKWGSYAEYIKYYQTLFPKENIYIIFYEEFLKNPKQEIQKLFSFLEVDSSVVPPSINKYIYDRASRKFYSLYAQSIINKFIGFYKNLPNIVRFPLKKIGVRKLLRKLKHLNRYKGNSQKFEKPTIDPAIHERLKKFYKNDIEELETLLNKRLDFWK
ncbi:MAG: sulfotransferase domain-containing protein [Candidatus Pacebacteria bacterium]|jgi:hypothetical protein|nr:sulfotransferase domain-containing protein [Candidatus Paceibacterota bacterium]